VEHSLPTVEDCTYIAFIKELNNLAKVTLFFVSMSLYGQLFTYHYFYLNVRFQYKAVIYQRRLSH
jgi:hypothetical protein